VALFNGAAQYINENPFDIELDPARPARPRQYWKGESAHYYNHEDHPLRVGKKLLTGSTHMPAPTKSLWFAMWKFVRDGRADVYLQRILDHSTNTKGFKIAELEARAKEGIPALLNSRTTPKAVGFEQVADSQPWYTKSGRLEFYREEDEFIEDGDYVWIDGDPEDRPFRGWQKNRRDYEFARLLCRARYYPGTPRGVTRMWFNMYGATPGSQEGQRSRPDGLAKNPRTNYQAMFRSGSHQSATRGWLKPTWMTDSLVRKSTFGQSIGKGFLPDVHCPTGAPREAIVKITRAEPGGIAPDALWRPAALGIRPRYESAEMKRYLSGEFITAHQAPSPVRSPGRAQGPGRARKEK
jgi:hypothetical protein